MSDKRSRRKYRNHKRQQLEFETSLQQEKRLATKHASTAEARASESE
jgi:hypothetical protein